MKLLTNEIIFLYLVDNTSEEYIFPPDYRLNLGIYPDKEIKKFLDLQLILCELNINETLSSFTIPELKKILKEYSLTVSGKKTDLITRLLQNVSNNDLAEKYGKKYYTLTNNGKELIKNNYVYILNYTNNYGFTDSEIKKSYISCPTPYSDRDRIWSIFNNKLNSYSRKKEFEQVYETCFSMGNFLYDEDNIEQALTFYIACFILQLSDTYGFGDEECDSTYIPEYLTDRIKKCVCLLNLPYNKLDNYIINDKICKGCRCFFSHKQLCNMLKKQLGGIEYNYKKNATKNVAVTKSAQKNYNLGNEHISTKKIFSISNFFKFIGLFFLLSVLMGIFSADVNIGIFCVVIILGIVIFRKHKKNKHT